MKCRRNSREIQISQINFKNSRYSRVSKPSWFSCTTPSRERWLQLLLEIPKPSQRGHWGTGLSPQSCGRFCACPGVQKCSAIKSARKGKFSAGKKGRTHSQGAECCFNTLIYWFKATCALSQQDSFFPHPAPHPKKDFPLFL